MHLDFSFDSLHLSTLRLLYASEYTKHSVQLNVGKACLFVFIFFSCSPPLFVGEKINAYFFFFLPENWEKIQYIVRTYKSFPFTY